MWRHAWGDDAHCYCAARHAAKRFNDQMFAGSACFISPTNKRTEGRAPLWGSEFTTKVATLQGDSAEIAPRLNVKLWVRWLRGGD